MGPFLTFYIGSVAVSAFATIANAKILARTIKRKGLVMTEMEENLHKFQNNKHETVQKLVFVYGSLFIPIVNILLATTMILVNSNKKIEEQMYETKCIHVKDINLDHIENSPYTDKEQLEKYINDVAQENIPLQEKKNKIKNFHINGTLPLQTYRLIKSMHKANEVVDKMNLNNETEQRKLTEKLVTKYRKELKTEQKELKSYGKKLEKTIFKTR